jgi:PAS domain S-box-containing protein
VAALDSLLALAPDPMLVLDPEDRVTAANDLAAELFGCAPAELTGLPVERLLDPPRDPAAVELVARRRDGAELLVEASRAQHGGVTVLSLRDATERHGRQAHLREAGQRFQRVFEDGPVGMGLVDHDFRLLEVNDAFCRLTGYDAEELRGRTFAEITHPDDVDTDLRLARRLFAGEVPGYSIDKRYVRKDGGVVWVELTVSVIRDESGRPLRGMGLVQDITERRRALHDAQAALASLARERDRILEFAGEGIYHVDSRGRITFANPAAGQMLGWTPGELIGKPAAELLGHRRADGSHHLTRRDGTSFPVHFRSNPDGATGEVVVFSDESERVRMETALDAARGRAARERLQAAESERARWARELHDETLQGLAGLSMLLFSAGRATSVEAMGARIAQAQEQIEDEMEKLRGLISELRPAALDELGLEASVRDLAERTRAVFGLEVEIVVDLPAQGEGSQRLATEVETAAYRIVQESLSNAARHAGASRVVVELARRNGALEVSVRDDGGGFDPSGTTGAGFGLRGMRERVDLLDGSIEIATGPGRGTRVSAALPLGYTGRSDGSTRPRSRA